MILILYYDYLKLLSHSHEWFFNLTAMHSTTKIFVWVMITIGVCLGTLRGEATMYFQKV